MAKPPGDMNRHLLRVFEARVEEQCLVALRAAQDLTVAIANLDTTRAQFPDLGDARSTEFAANLAAARAAFVRDARRSQSDVWRAAQSFVVAVANLSKLFWGGGGKLEAQREPLRRALGVRDTSHFRPTTMRNHFEHFDERIDLWWNSSPGRNYIDANIGPIGVTGNVGRKDFFRGYDPATGDLTFWGTQLNVRDVCAELTDILERASAELNEWMLSAEPSGLG